MQRTAPLRFRARSNPTGVSVTARLIAGLVVTVVALAVAAYRVQWLGRVGLAGPDIPPERRPSVAGAMKAQLVDVFAQRKLFKRPLSGWAHAFTFWAFIVLLLTIIEAFGALFTRDFAIPVIGRYAVVGFIEDLFATLVLVALGIFSVIRVAQSPKRLDRRSPFFETHLDPARVGPGLIFLLFPPPFFYPRARI